MTKTISSKTPGVLREFCVVFCFQILLAARRVFNFCNILVNKHFSNNWRVSQVEVRRRNVDLVLSVHFRFFSSERTSCSLSCSFSALFLSCCNWRFKSFNWNRLTIFYFCGGINLKNISSGTSQRKHFCDPHHRSSFLFVDFLGVDAIFDLLIQEKNNEISSRRENMFTFEANAIHKWTCPRIFCALTFLGASKFSPVLVSLFFQSASPFLSAQLKWHSPFSERGTFQQFWMS